MLCAELFIMAEASSVLRLLSVSSCLACVKCYSAILESLLSPKKNIIAALGEVLPWNCILKPNNPSWLESGILIPHLCAYWGVGMAAPAKPNFWNWVLSQAVFINTPFPLTPHGPLCVPIHLNNGCLAFPVLFLNPSFYLASLILFRLPFFFLSSTLQECRHSQACPSSNILSVTKVAQIKHFHSIHCKS